MESGDKEKIEQRKETKDLIKRLERIIRKEDLEDKESEGFGASRTERSEGKLGATGGPP